MTESTRALVIMAVVVLAYSYIATATYRATKHRFDDPILGTRQAVVSACVWPAYWTGRAMWWATEWAQGDQGSQVER